MVKKTLLEWRWSLAGPAKFDEFPARTLEVPAEHLSGSGRVRFKVCWDFATCAVDTLGDAAGRRGEPSFTMRHEHAQLNCICPGLATPCMFRAFGMTGAFTNVHSKKGKCNNQQRPSIQSK